MRKCSVPFIEEAGEGVLRFHLVHVLLAVFDLLLYCCSDGDGHLRFEAHLHLVDTEAL